MRDLLAQIARHHLELGALYQELAERDGRRDLADDRVLTLQEAAVRLGCTVSWLSRRENYAKVGGYLGEDRRVHFGQTALRAYLEAASKRT